MGTALRVSVSPVLGAGSSSDARVIANAVSREALTARAVSESVRPTRAPETHQRAESPRAYIPAGFHFRGPTRRSRYGARIGEWLTATAGSGRTTAHHPEVQ